MLLALLLACAPNVDRVVLVGMDGLDRELLTSMMADGDLPTFSKVIEEGAIADLHTTKPMISPIIWTTVASGYPGEVHGIGGWTSEFGEPFTSADTRVWRIWDVATQHGIETVSIGWLMTWPASPIQGAMITDKLVWALPMNKDPEDPTVSMAQEEHGDLYGLAMPTQLQTEVQQWQPTDAEREAHPLAYQFQSYAGPFHPFTRDETHVRAFESLWKQGNAQLGMLYLVGADQVSHLYWPFLDPLARRRMRENPNARIEAAAADRARVPGRRHFPYAETPLTPADVDEAARWVPDYYRYLDSVLARVIAQIDQKTTTLMVMSDHGFRTSRTNVVLGGGHRDPAVLMAWGNRVKPGASIEDASVLDIAPTLLALNHLPAAQDMSGRVLSEMVEATAVEPVKSYVDNRKAPEAKPKTTRDPATEKMLQQLEALGYIDDRGAPVLGASRNLGQNQ